MHFARKLPKELQSKEIQKTVDGLGSRHYGTGNLMT